MKDENTEFSSRWDRKIPILDFCFVWASVHSFKRLEVFEKMEYNSVKLPLMKFSFIFVLLVIFFEMWMQVSMFVYSLSRDV